MSYVKLFFNCVNTPPLINKNSLKINPMFFDEFKKGHYDELIHIVSHEVIDTNKTENVSVFLDIRQFAYTINHFSTTIKSYPAEYIHLISFIGIDPVNKAIIEKYHLYDPILFESFKEKHSNLYELVYNELENYFIEELNRFIQNTTMDILLKFK